MCFSNPVCPYKMYTARQKKGSTNHNVFLVFETGKAFYRSNTIIMYVCDVLQLNQYFFFACVCTYFLCPTINNYKVVKLIIFNDSKLFTKDPCN